MLTALKGPDLHLPFCLFRHMLSTISVLVSFCVVLYGELGGTVLHSNSHKEEMLFIFVQSVRQEIHMNICSPYESHFHLHCLNNLIFYRNTVSPWIM